MTFYHYTCSHRAALIAKQRWLTPNRHPLLAAGPVVWLTDLETPERDGLGLTSNILTCDRTEWRVTASTNEAIHWPVFAKLFGRSIRDNFEIPGTLPMHWWVCLMPVAVLDLTLREVAS